MVKLAGWKCCLFLSHGVHCSPTVLTQRKFDAWIRDMDGHGIFACAYRSQYVAIPQSMLHLKSSSGHPSGTGGMQLPIGAAFLIHQAFSEPFSVLEVPWHSLCPKLLWYFLLRPWRQPHLLGVQGRHVATCGNRMQRDWMSNFMSKSCIRFCINWKTWTLVSCEELDYATNFLADGPGEWKDSGLGEAFRAAVANPDGINVIDWKPYGPSSLAKNIKPWKFVQSELLGL